MSISRVAAGVVQGTGLAAEVVVGLIPVPVLLVAEDVERCPYYLEPRCIEDRGVSSLLPILVCQSVGIAQGVNLVLALV